MAETATPTQATEARASARRSVLIAYGVITLVGAFFFSFSFQYDFFRGDSGQVGAGFLPRVVSVLVMVLGLALMRQELRGGSRLTGDSGVAEEEQALDSRTARKLAVVFGLMTLALLLVPVLGLVLPLVALVLALTVGVERAPLLPSLAVTVGAAVIGYVLFVTVLNIPLPMGVLEGVL